MNDFTKEELEYLRTELHARIMSEYRPRIELTISSKIKSLIDNYCEHDGEIGKDYPAEKCMKCGAYWE